MLDARKSAHRKLVEAIEQLYSDLKKSRLLPDGLRRRLLILSLLIEYLDERQALPNNYFGKFLPGATKFFEVLQNGRALVELLQELENRFNGNVFALTDEEQAALKSTKQLERFARLIEGFEEPGGQLTLWRLYSFKDLPVELISHIYQLFVKDAASSVYTPPALVRLMLGEALSWERLDALMAGEEIILDPACGSGVFLVEAYKRLVLHWRSKNNWEPPRTNVLKSLLKRVHGIDLEPGAVELTAFSLCLALCDALEPEEIRKTVKLFDRLAGTSIHEGCFFEAKNKGVIKKPIGVIVGNPPFESKLTTSGAVTSYENYKEKHGRLADNQLAYLFIHEAMEMITKGGVLCMIEPAGFLYNMYTASLRRSFFERWNVREILDFVSVRGLFKKGDADPKIVIVVASAEKPRTDDRLLHAVFRRSGRAYAEQVFDIDYYDLHWISKNTIDQSNDAWRANLLGGGRVFSFISRLRSMRTLKEFAEERANWDFGEGFNPGSNGKSRPDHLIGKPLLPTSALSSDGIDRESITSVPNRAIEGPRTERRFTPPMLLVKEHEDLFHALWEESYITYKNEIVGLCAPRDDAIHLRKIEKWLKCERVALSAYVAGISTRLFTQRATAIFDSDIKSLPYPEEGDLDLSENERVIAEDIVDFQRDYVRKGSKAPLMKLSAHEGLPKFNDLFVGQINAVYAERTLVPAKSFQWPGVICQPFVFGDGKIDWTDADSLRGKLDSLLREQRGDSLTITRIARIYDGDFLFLLKPDRLRFWTRSIALKDADDVLADLRRQGF